MTQYNDVQIQSIQVLLDSDNKKFWQIKVKIKKHWLKNLFLNKNSELPTRTFIGYGGLMWSEIKEKYYYGVGDLTPILNSIIAIELLKTDIDTNLYYFNKWAI